jgi:hypothetical protein
MSLQPGRRGSQDTGLASAGCPGKRLAGSVAQRRRRMVVQNSHPDPLLHRVCGRTVEQRTAVQTLPGRNGRDDAVAHWMMFERWRPPSAPDRTFPDTREHGSIHPPKVGENSRDRHHRSAFWFAHTRRGGGAILHHRRIRLVLIRDWSPKMDGIAATIGASQTTSSTWPRGQPRT